MRIAVYKKYVSDSKMSTPEPLLDSWPPACTSLQDKCQKIKKNKGYKFSCEHNIHLLRKRAMIMFKMTRQEILHLFRLDTNKHL